MEKPGWITFIGLLTFSFISTALANTALQAVNIDLFWFPPFLACLWLALLGGNVFLLCLLRSFFAKRMRRR